MNYDLELGYVYGVLVVIFVSFVVSVIIKGVEEEKEKLRGIID